MDRAAKRAQVIADAIVLHRTAMEFSERAMLQTAAGRRDLTKELLAAAFEMESQAANLVSPFTDLEPTRSVLHRSAAALALDCGQFRAAEELIARALAGHPPPKIQAELADLLVRAKAGA